MSGSQDSKMGRPSEYSPEVAKDICERIADGESLRTICKDEEMPGRTTVLRWLAEREDFRGQYAGAREAQADHMADEILEIADNASDDTIQTDFGPKPDSEWINRSKLRVESRFKLMALLSPKKYGTKLVDVTSGGQKLTGIKVVDIGAK